MHQMVWKKMASLIVGAVCIICVCLFSGCGGGGGGGGTDTTTDLSYSGLETPVVITATNAQEIASSAYYSGSAGAVFAGIAALKDNEQTEMESGRPFLLDVTSVFKDAVGKIDFSAVSNYNQAVAFQSESGSIPGDCGGSAFFNIQVNTESGGFSGSLDFQNFCSEEITINGQSTFSGILNTETEELESFRLGVENITGISGAESFTIEGSLDFNVSSQSIVMTLDLLFRDDNLNKVYRLENYQMVITEESSYFQIGLSGRFYNPDYGYVDMSTSQPFLVGLYDDHPYLGQLLLTGENGSAGGPTCARLTAISAIQCQVEADIDGDDSYGGSEDYDSGAISWVELW